MRFVNPISMSPLTLALECLIGVVSLLYAFGVWRLWTRTGLGHGLPAWRAASFLSGMLLLGGLLAATMDRLADHSFAAHMLQHVLLMKAVVPLLLLGEFSVVFLYAIGGRTAHALSFAWSGSAPTQRAWRSLTSPWFTWSFFFLATWIWHAPPFYEAALQHEWLHVLEHAFFFASSLLFWWYLLKPSPDRAGRCGVAVLYLFTTLLHESALGALLTFSAKSWYPFYAGIEPWGWTALADQQVAGLIMWVPGGLLFGVLIVYFFGAWMNAIEERMRTRHPEYAIVGDRHD